MAAPSAASSTMRLAGASSAAVTATTTSSCARRRTCSWTGLRANSWIFRKTTLARVAAAFAVFICQEPTVLRSYRLPTPCAYNPRRDSVTDVEREQRARNDRTQGRQPRGGFRGHRQERQAGEHSLAGARLVPARAGAQAPLRREGPLLLVLRELPRRAVPSGPPRRRLPRGPGVARLRGVLFGRVAPHLRKVRPRHAEACGLGDQPASLGPSILLLCIAALKVSRVSRCMRLERP